MKTVFSSTSPKFNRGFSLIEVLISIVVMTFGLLGISGLMMKGIDNSTGTELALRATQSANEIIDAMRANPTNVNNYLMGWNKNLADFSTLTPIDQVERRGWLNDLRTKLPGGDGEIRTDPDPLVTNGFIVSVRFVNCIGTMTATQIAACAASSNNNEKRTLQFKFKV